MERRTARPAVIAALAVTLVLALGAGALVWFTQFRDRGDGPGLDDWSYTPVSALAVDGGADFNPRSVVGGGGLLVAVGDAPDPAGDGYNLDAWYSTDGVTWHTGDLRSVSRGAGWYTEFLDLMAWDGGFLVVGKGIDNSGALPTTSASDRPVWTSKDGRSWRPLDPPRDAADGSLTVHTDGTHAYASLGDTPLWRLASPDGPWQRTGITAPEGCGFTGRVETSGGDGLLLTGTCAPNENTRPALYRADGEDASAVRDLAGTMPDGLIGPLTDVAVRGDTLVAAAYQVLTGEEAEAVPPAPDGGDLAGDGPAVPPARGVLLRSEDGGAHWAEAENLPVPEDAKPGSGKVDDLILSGDTFVATGSVVINELLRPALWVSRDGGTWTSHRLRAFAEDGYLGSGAALDGRVVLPALYGYGPIHTAGLITNSAEPSGTASRAAPTGGARPSTLPGTLPSTRPAVPPSASAAASASATASSSASASSSATPSAPTTDDVYALMAPWGGEITGGSGPRPRYEVLLALSSGDPEPRLESLTGTLFVKGDGGCTAGLGGPQVRGDGTLVFRPVVRKNTMPGTVFDGAAYCPEIVEVRRTGAAELSWSSEGGYTGTLVPGPVD